MIRHYCALIIMCDTNVFKLQTAVDRVRKGRKAIPELSLLFFVVDIYALSQANGAKRITEQMHSHGFCPKKLTNLILDVRCLLFVVCNWVARS